MSIKIKGSRNYSATVIKVPKVRKAENSDRLYIIDALGITAIVDESWVAREGELALIFPAEAQLSEDFTRANNLYRDWRKNNTLGQTGYLEDNRRVRALKLRGNISNGLAMPLTSLATLKHSDSTPAALNMMLAEGDVFDTFLDQEICRKYEIEEKGSALTKGERQVKKAFKRVDEVFLPAHFDTSHWEREKHRVPLNAQVIVTQKLHGTSCRLGHTIVKRKLTWLEKIAQGLGVAVRDHDYDLVAGSKRVIKDPNNPNQAHFYGTDVWTSALETWGDRIPKNHVVYGELVGFIPGTETPIQKGHTYECAPGEYELYVYRVAIVTEAGDMIDLSWNQVRSFCERHGLKHVPELIRTKSVFLHPPALEEKNFWEDHQSSIREDELSGFNDTPVRLSPGGTGKDEGFAVRVDSGFTPEFFKFKNKSHYLWESGELDSGESDLESRG